MSDELIEKAQKRLEHMKRTVYKTATPYMPGVQWRWVFGFTDMGKAVLWGPYNTLAEAESSALPLDTFEVFVLDTRNTAKASREVKAILISRGEDPDEAMKRLIHHHNTDGPDKPTKKHRFW